MLYFALSASAIFLIVAILALFSTDKPYGRVLAVCGIGTVASMGLCAVLLPPVMIQGLGMILAAILSLSGLRRRWAFVPLALIATCIAYGIAARNAVEYERRLKEQYPVESMAERLPYPPVRSAALAAVSESALADLEVRMTQEAGEVSGLPSRGYLQALEAMHGEARQAFVNSPGFGVVRMDHLERNLRIGPRDEYLWGPPLPQPSPDERPVWSFGDLPTGAPGWLLPEQTETAVKDHQRLVEGFAHPWGFGVVVNRQAAGFKRHQFGVSARPEPESKILGLQLRTLDLVGLVVAPEPRVYVTKNLPRMDELADAPTRALDGFEQAGLKDLLAGETLFVRQLGDRVRMLGAIRSVKQCVGCHGGQRGDLLGAFSYTLMKVEK
jgi:hypothetical protein